MFERAPGVFYYVVVDAMGYVLEQELEQEVVIDWPPGIKLASCCFHRALI